MLRPYCNIFSVYVIFLLLLAPFNLLSFDTYYYWEWSRHLALSYYDGSPMIAYFIKLSTLLFGDTLFALSSVGIATVAITTLVIYKTARLFLNKEASGIAAFLWLFSPFMTLDILKQTTYDTPLALFWTLTLYYSIKFIAHRHEKDLYGIGVCIGLMMLSKYSGVILLLALFIFLILSSHRYLFKTRTFYLALLISTALFSPVIVWNYQHDWQSFLYQLTTHKLHSSSLAINNLIHSFFLIILPSLNVMLLPPFLCWFYRNDSKNNDILKLCRISSSVFLCCYCLIASYATIRSNWLTPYLITSALLGGYCFQTYHYRRTLYCLIIINAIASIVILSSSTTLLQRSSSKKFTYYQLLKAFNSSHPDLPKTIVTPGWFEARMLFFLNHKTTINTIECGSPQNQYLSWSAVVIDQIKHHNLQEVLFVDPANRINCMTPYFKTCVQESNSQSLYIYRCSHPKTS